MSKLADVAEKIVRLKQERVEFCVATVVRAQAATAAKAGNKALVAADGEITGFLGGGCVEHAVRTAATAALASRVPKLIRVKPGDEVNEKTDADGVELHKSGCPSRGTVDIFIEPMNLPAQLIVFGFSAVAVALANQASALGYKVTVAGTSAPPDNLASSVAQVDDFAALAKLAGAGDYAVVATQGKGDLKALEAALDSEAGYVSLVCSKRKAKHLLEQLAKAGKVPAAKRKRLKYPAGLDIQAIEPEEIALSIVAEIIQVRRRKARASKG